MSFLDRLFSIQQRERAIQEKANALLKSHMELAQSYALLQEEWERLNTCSKRLTEIMQSEESAKKAGEFTEADKIAARGMGITIQ